MLQEARAPDGLGPGFGEESGGECGSLNAPSFLAGCVAAKAQMKFTGGLLKLQMFPTF